MHRPGLILPLTLRVALYCLVAVLTAAPGARAQTNSLSDTNRISRPLSLTEALNIALQQNGTLQKANADLEASHGIVMQTRAVVLPRLEAFGNYLYRERGSIETFPFASPTNVPTTNNATALANQNWEARVQVVQSIYEGGRMVSGLRSAQLTKEQAILQHRTVVADTLLAVRIGYYDVLVAEQQIVVNEASVNLLAKELEDQRRRYEAGTVPRFNLLRAEVAVANARPPLIRARNAYRIAKNNLANLLGYDLPREIWVDIPLQLTDKLEAEPYQIELPAAIAEALERRTELGSLRKQVELEHEGIRNAHSGYKPSVQVLAGYNWRNAQFTDDPSRHLTGWFAGAQLNWNIFDGLLTQGKIRQARALQERSKADLDDTARRIELEVRTAYSTFIEAREVLESQEKVQEEAREALRLAAARSDAGTGTQLDVLNAETSLTQAATTQVQALHDYAVARSRLERAIGRDLVSSQ